VTSSSGEPLGLGLYWSIKAVRYSRASADRRSASTRAALGVAVGWGVVFRVTVGAGCALGIPVGKRAKPGSCVRVGVGVGDATGGDTAVGSEVAVAAGIDVAELVGSAVASSVAGDDVGSGLAGDAVVPQATSVNTATDSPVEASQPGTLLGRLKLRMTEHLPAQNLGTY